MTSYSRQPFWSCIGFTHTLTEKDKRSGRMSGVQFNQDLPPPGGYEPIRYKRNLPARGPGGLAIFGGVIAICTYGFWRLGQGNLEQR